MKYHQSHMKVIDPNTGDPMSWEGSKGCIADMSNPGGLALSADGTLLALADTGNHRKISKTHEI